MGALIQGVNVEWYLDKWGAYVRSGGHDIGHAHKNILYKLMHEKFAAGEPGDYTPREIYISKENEIIDNALGCMPTRLRRALYCRYVYRLSVRRGAQKMRMPRESYRKLVGESEQYIAGYFNACRNSEKKA